MSGFDFSLKSKPCEVRRLEVLSGDLGRRRWPDDVKARIVGESYAPDAVVSVVARRHGLRPQQLFHWRRLAREGDLALPSRDDGEDLAFSPVVMAASGEERTAPADELGAGVIEIALGGAVVRVRGGADTVHLRQVLGAVRAVE